MIVGPSIFVPFLISAPFGVPGIRFQLEIFVEHGHDVLEGLHHLQCRLLGVEVHRGRTHEEPMPKVHWSEKGPGNWSENAIEPALHVHQWAAEAMQWLAS